MDDARRVKIAKTEALYRSVNEKIEGLNEAFVPVLQTMVVICECGDDTCVEQLEVEVSLYERVRADGTLFIVKSGHEIPEVEETVETHQHFSIVCKNKGPGEAVARQTDPRA